MIIKVSYMCLYEIIMSIDTGISNYNPIIEIIQSPFFPDLLFSSVIVRNLAPIIFNIFTYLFKLGSCKKFQNC
jgi:hypothetical protein